MRWRRQRLIGIAIALVLIVGACLIPGSEVLEREGIITLGALLALAVLWATSALPIGIIALLIPVLLIVLGAADAKSVFSGYAATPLFFIVAVFALPVIMQKTKWGLRLINMLLKWTGSDSRKLVLGFMIATTLVSTVMSDAPTTVLFLGLALTILKAAGAKPGSSNLGKCLRLPFPLHPLQAVLLLLLAAPSTLLLWMSCSRPLVMASASLLGMTGISHHHVLMICPSRY